MSPQTEKRPGGDRDASSDQAGRQVEASVSQASDTPTLFDLEPTESPLIGTRILKAHLDATKAVLPTVLEMFDDDPNAAAHLVAEAVVTALDGVKTRYCVGVRTKAGATLIYGPYASVGAANKAIQTGQVGIDSTPGARAGIFPLISAPKAGG